MRLSELTTKATSVHLIVDPVAFEVGHGRMGLHLQVVILTLAHQTVLETCKCGEITHTRSF